MVDAQEPHVAIEKLCTRFNKAHKLTLDEAVSTASASIRRETIRLADLIDSSDTFQYVDCAPGY